MAVNLSKSITLGAPQAPQSQRNLMTEVVLLVIASAVFFWFLVLPKQSTVSDQAQSYDKLKTQESSMSNQVTELQTMVKNMQSNPDDVNILDQALPLEDKSIRLESLLTTLADSVGVTVGNVSANGTSNTIVSGDKTLLADPYAPTRTLQQDSASVYVIGTFDQLMAFLKKIETSGRIMDITTLQIDQSTGGLLNMRVDLNAYFLGPPPS